MEAMEAFHMKCPEVGFSEYRSMAVPAGGELPAGHYGFMELYCNAPKCDCRRVTISVVAPGIARRPLATISYGWETPAFYRKWMHDSPDGDEMAGASLDLLGPQSEYSVTLKEYFEEVIATDEYVERLKRHYDLFKQAIVARRRPMDPEVEERRRAVRARLRKRRRRGR